MHFYYNFCEYLSNILKIDLEHIFLILNTIILIVIMSIIKKIVKYLVYLIKDERKEFIYNQRFKIVLNVVEFIFLFFIWDNYLKSIISLISFLSAAIAVALRDIILNWFCGIYNRIKKVFKIEDRIEIDGLKGDVVLMSSLGFELLEVNDNENNGQSTGVLVHYPYTVIFTKPIKNITKGFKYVWNEMQIRIPLNANLIVTKKELYKIINNIDEIKNTPNKMKNAIKNINAEYHIYYNQFNPIIYTKVVESHIELTIRYLINPKKARYIESTIWNKILIAHQNNTIKLYED